MYVAGVMPQLLHIAALRYIVTTCHYLGIPRVAIATERFSLDEAMKGSRDAQKMYEHIVSSRPRYHKYLTINDSKWVHPFQVRMFDLDLIHKYPLYELINLTHLANDVDVELVQTGQVDQAALALTMGDKAKPSQLKVEQDAETDRHSGDVAQIIAEALQMTDINQARDYVAKKTPATWNKCIYAEHNRSLLS